MPNFFAKNLKYLRSKIGEKQASIAIKVNKGQTTIGNWEAGISQPNIEELAILSNFFGISIDDFINTDIEKGKVLPQVEDDKKHQKGKGIGKGIGKGNTHLEAISGHIKEPKIDYQTACKECLNKEEAIRQRDVIIAALNGQIKALEMAVKHAEARLEDIAHQKRKAG